MIGTARMYHYNNSMTEDDKKVIDSLDSYITTNLISLTLLGIDIKKRIKDCYIENTNQFKPHKQGIAYELGGHLKVIEDAINVYLTYIEEFYGKDKLYAYMIILNKIKNS